MKKNTQDSNVTEGPPQAEAKAKKKKKKRMPAAAVIVIDLLIAASALYVFSLYYFLLPQDLSNKAQMLPRAISDVSDAKASALAKTEL